MYICVYLWQCDLYINNASLKKHSHKSKSISNNFSVYSQTSSQVTKDKTKDNNFFSIAVLTTQPADNNFDNTTNPNKEKVVSPCDGAILGGLLAIA